MLSTSSKNNSKQDARSTMFDKAGSLKFNLPLLNMLILSSHPSCNFISKEIPISKLTAICFQSHNIKGIFFLSAVCPHLEKTLKGEQHPSKQWGKSSCTFPCYFTANTHSLKFEVRSFKPPKSHFKETILFIFAQCLNSGKKSF